MAELFVREVLGFLVQRELFNPEGADRLPSWRHTGFNVHGRVRARTKREAERVEKYVICPLLSLERLSLDEREGRVTCRWKETREAEQMDYQEFFARVTSHIPDKGRATVRYCGLYANVHRGKLRKACPGPFPLRMVEDELQPIPSKGRTEMVRKVDEADPMACPQCAATMINHLKLTFVAEWPPPPHIAYLELLLAAGLRLNIFRDSLLVREKRSVDFP